MFLDIMLIPLSAHLHDFSRARRFSFLAAFFLATLASATFLQSVSIGWAQTPTPSSAATTAQEETTKPGESQSASPEAPTTSNVPHGDVWVFAATMLLVGATLLLVGVTFLLWLTTKRHVAHTQALVNTVNTILEIDRIPRLAVLVSNGVDGKPCARVQNLGRIPLVLDKLILEFFDHNNDLIEKADIEGVQNVWILPNDAYTICHPTLSATWNEGRPSAVRIECTFFDVYSEGNKTRRRGPNRSSWMCDHDKRIVRAV